MFKFAIPVLHVSSSTAAEQFYNLRVVKIGYLAYVPIGSVKKGEALAARLE